MHHVPYIVETSLIIVEGRDWNMLRTAAIYYTLFNIGKHQSAAAHKFRCVFPNATASRSQEMWGEIAHIRSVLWQTWVEYQKPQANYFQNPTQRATATLTPCSPHKSLRSEPNPRLSDSRQLICVICDSERLQDSRSQDSKSCSDTFTATSQLWKLCSLNLARRDWVDILAFTNKN